MPLTKSEKNTVRDNALAQLKSFSDKLGVDLIPRKYWTEYAERLANAGKRDDEVAVADIVNLLQAKGSIFNCLPSVYHLLVADAVAYGLERKYKDEWPK